MDENYKYEPKPEIKLRNDYSRRKKSGDNGFENLEDFLQWYNEKKKVCFYCGLKEEELQYIVHMGILKSKRFPIHGEFARGRSRGYWLEIDRKNPKGIYSRDNCELSCYFCNNDKSDIFNTEQYMKFREDRTGYLRSLLLSK